MGKKKNKTPQGTPSSAASASEQSSKPDAGAPVQPDHIKTPPQPVFNEEKEESEKDDMDMSISSLSERSVDYENMLHEDLLSVFLSAITMEKWSFLLDLQQLLTCPCSCY